MFDHVWPMWCQGVHWLHNLLDHLHFDSDFTWPTGRVHVHVTQDRLERIHHRLSSYRRLWSSMIWPDSSMFVGDLTIFNLWIHHWKLHDFPIDSKCPCQFRDFPAMLAGEYEDICQGCLIFFAAIWKRVARWWWKLKKNRNFSAACGKISLQPHMFRWVPRYFSEKFLPLLPSLTICINDSMTEPQT